MIRTARQFNGNGKQGGVKKKKNRGKIKECSREEGDVESLLTVTRSMNG